MKYSEAIRLGSMLGPQWDGTFPKTKEAICANQAAMKAMGVGHYTEIPAALIQSQCPVCGEKDVIAGVVACCLNDKHKWTREQIADWVATVEPKEPILPVGEYCDVHQEAVTADNRS